MTEMECPICAGSLFEEGHEGPAALYCGHVMHKDCCLMWFNAKLDYNNKICPVCRKPSSKARIIPLFLKPGGMAPSADNPRPPNPQTLQMIKHAIESQQVSGTGSRKGVSVQAIKKFIVGQYKVDMKIRGNQINEALRSAIISGDLINTSGVVAAVGSFKLPNS